MKKKSHSIVEVFNFLFSNYFIQGKDEVIHYTKSQPLYITRA